MPGNVITSNLSPNFGTRGGKVAEWIVCHYTRGSKATGSVKWLCDPRAKASTHYLVSRAGQIYKLVPERLAAWHAGVSEAPYQGEMTSGVNDFSIGIEFANLGKLIRAGGTFGYRMGDTLYTYRGHPPRWGAVVYDDGQKVDGWWEPYTDAQIEAGAALIADLRKRMGLKLTGHEDVAQPLGRKMDPGPLFPWERFGGREYARTRAMLRV